MLNNVSELINFYHSEQEFSMAISHTAEKTGFSVELIEKDYFCSIVLLFLFSDKACPLIFKGGTLLAKTYANFYRLSEDLDFTIPVPYNATRKRRSNEIKPLKEILASIESSLPIVKIRTPLQGSNESRQYNMELNYPSQVSPREGKIFIEIGLREELLQPAIKASANTLLVDPYTASMIVAPIVITALSLKESYAEKTRAALCRKKLAIRDFYDLDYALTNRLIDLEEKTLISLIKKKIDRETHIHDLTDPTVTGFLSTKIKNELEPTLKQSNISKFNLLRIVEKLSALTTTLKRENTCET